MPGKTDITCYLDALSIDTYDKIYYAFALEILVAVIFQILLC